MKMNKKGFTLVELLAVIVILAIVMLVGVTAVGPVMEKTRKNAIIDEGLTIMDAALLAYESDEAFSETTITLGKAVSIDKLGSYYTKKDAGFEGTVIVSKDLDSDEITTSYCLWNSNTGYGIENGSASTTVSDIDKFDENPCEQ